MVGSILEVSSFNFVSKSPLIDERQNIICTVKGLKEHAII